MFLEVRRSVKGPQIYVSRTHKGFLRRLFELEVPEIHAGTVEIKAIAREAGSRSKVAVASRQQGLDPVGATVGQRGARVQAVVGGARREKIDVIDWSEEPSTFVAKALSPAQVIEVRIDEEHRIANVVVPERMLSLAIRPRGPERPAGGESSPAGARYPERRVLSPRRPRPRLTPGGCGASRCRFAGDRAGNVAVSGSDEPEPEPAAVAAAEAPAKPKRRKAAKPAEPWTAR